MTAMINQEVFQMDRFTAKPKWWGKLRHKSKLKASEYLALDVIYDKTLDWGKTTDRISISQFEDELGLSNRSILDSLQGLVSKGLISINGEQRKINIISINIKQCEVYATSSTGEKFSKTGEKSSLDDGLKSGEKFSKTGEKFSKTGEKFSKTGEKFSKTGEKSSHTRNHNTKPLHDTNTLDHENAKDKKPKTQKFDPLNFEIPSYVNSDLWKSYHEMRAAKGKKSIASENACRLILKDFEIWNESGLDVNEALENSIKSNWTGVFEPKRKINNQNTQGFNHANNQPTFGQSSADSYAAKLQADLANRFPDEFGQPVGGYYVNQ